MSELTYPNEPDVARLSRMVLAGEDVAELVDLVRALNVELAPQTHLERRQVEHIALTEFEVDRRRRRVAEVDPRSTFRWELEMIDDLLDDLVASLPYAHEAVARRAGLLRASVTIESADCRRAARYLAEASSARGKALARFLEAVRVAARAPTTSGDWGAVPRG